MSETILTCKNISKRYTDSVGYTINLLKDVTIEIKESEFISILAPKGSGKSSLLKILADLEPQTEGVIETAISKRIFIPSLPSSFPWLNVIENISYNSTYDKAKINEIINLVGLKGYEYHFPHNKSEGFRIRISLGRAIANNPGMLIIDEPFNNLNTETRTEVYQLFRDVQLKMNIPFVLGTTNLTEAIYLSDRIILMKKNPGEVVEIVDLDIPKQREIKMIESGKFISTRNKIEEIFKNKTDRQLYNFSI